MHGKFFKKVIAVTLAIALVIGGLPLMAGRLISAMASTNVETYEDLVAALERNGDSTQKNDVDVTLGADITVNGTIYIDSGMLDSNTQVVINGNGHTITVENPGVDESGRINPSATATTLIEIKNTNTAKVLIKNVTLIGGSSSALVNNANSLVELVDSTVTRTAADVTVLNNNGSLLITNSNISRNIANGAVLSNEFVSYESCFPLQINGSTFNENRTNNNIISTKGKTSLGSTTIAGNIAPGYAYADVSSYAGSHFSEVDVSGNVTKGVYFASPASLYKSTFVYNHELSDLDNMVDITLGPDANNSQFILDTVKYGNASNIDSVSNGTGVERITALNSTNIFKNYSIFHVVNNDGTYTRTVVLPTISPETNKHVKPNASVNLKKIYVEAGPNGSVTMDNVFGNVINGGTSLEVAATPDADYEFIDWIGIDSEGRTAVKSTTPSFFYGGADMVLRAEFAKQAEAKVTVTLNGNPWSGRNVTLNRFGTPIATLVAGVGSLANEYKGNVYTGTYDIYVDGQDSGSDITVSESGTTALVQYASLEYTLDGGTGTVPPVGYYPKGTEVTIASGSGISKDGYKFAGWTDAYSNIYEPGTDVQLNIETTLKPNWSPLTVNAQITVRTNSLSDNGFTVTLYNNQLGTTYNLAYADGVYKGTVDNDSTYRYEVRINGTPMENTLDCVQIQNATYDYYKVTYHGNGNTDGQSEITNKVLKNSDITLPSGLFEKKGNDFVAWNSNEAGSGSDHLAGENVTVNGPKTFYAKWQAKTLQVTFDVDGGNPIPVGERTRMVTFGGQYGALPTPTRTGHTFLYWIEGSQVISATTNVTNDKNHTLKAVWSPNEYAITVPNGDSMKFTVTPDTGLYTALYGTNYGFTVAPIEGYSIDEATVSYVPSGSGNEPVVLTGTNGHYEIPGVDDDMTIMVSGVKDLIAPTGTIKIKQSTWQSFINTITFGLFYKEAQIVTFTAEDMGSGVADIYYFNTTNGESLTLDEVKAIPADMWTRLEGTNKVEVISPEDELVVYAKLVDNAGNVGYISSDGLVLDTTAPVISGAEDGGTYDGPLTLTVTDDHMDYVTVDGVKRTLSAEGTFSIAGQAGPVEVIAYDKADNQTKITITVNASADAEDGNVTEEFKVEGSAPSTTLSNEEGSIDNAVLSDADKTAVDQGEDINIRVEVKDETVVPDSDKSIVSANTTDKEVYKVFDISVFKDYLMRGNSQQVTRTDGALTFVFDIPEELRTAPEGYERTFFVGRVHEGEFTWLNDKDSSLSTITVDSNLFSTYVLAYKDAPLEVEVDDPDETTTTTTPNESDATTTTAPNGSADTNNGGSDSTTKGEQVANTDRVLTGDNAPILFTAILIVFGVSGAVVFGKKRREAGKA